MYILDPLQEEAEKEKYTNLIEIIDRDLLLYIPDPLQDTDPDHHQNKETEIDTIDHLKDIETDRHQKKDTDLDTLDPLQEIDLDLLYQDHIVSKTRNEHKNKKKY